MAVVDTQERKRGSHVWIPFVVKPVIPCINDEHQLVLLCQSLCQSDVANSLANSLLFWMTFSAQSNWTKGVKKRAFYHPPAGLWKNTGSDHLYCRFRKDSFPPSCYFTRAAFVLHVFVSLGVVTAGREERPCWVPSCNTDVATLICMFHIPRMPS